MLNLLQPDVYELALEEQESHISYLKDLLVVEDVSKADHEDDDQKQQADETLQLVLFRLLVAHPSRKGHL